MPKGLLIEHYIARPEHRTRHEVVIRAPADLVFKLACEMDMQAHPVARAIFWLREKLMKASPRPRVARGLVAETKSLGWGVLAERPGRELVMGAVTEPWEANVTFRAVRPEQFVEFAEPGLVKIAWSLEAEALAPAVTRLATETRVLPIGEVARQRFERYWRRFRPGILMLRLLMLPRLRRDAERAYRSKTR